MKIPFLMTPGPTQVRENVRFARAFETTNPDIDFNFYDLYKETCVKFGELLNTKEEVRILSGEGILGLEAACASLTEKGDRVLVIDNGIFGEGFAEFVELYGGEVVYFKGNRRREIDIEELKKFLDKDSNFKYATVVHCDTPSGVVNPIDKICPLLKEKGIITVVDSVSAMGGVPLKVDDWNIDIVLGGSQKCISAPAGLTILSISKEAFSVMKNRKTKIGSFYCNLLLWEDYYEKKWCPYTPPISDILGIRRAIDNILEEKDIIDRHEKIAFAVRKSVVECGLNLHLENGYSNTVTSIEMPYNIKSDELIKYIVDTYNVLISGSFGYLDGKVIRIGHMGENAYSHKITYLLMVLQKGLEHFGFKLKGDLSEKFLEHVK